MFGRLYKVVKSAAEDISDALTAPNRTPLEDFKESWQVIAQYVISEDQSGAGTPVDQTTIPAMFDTMLLRLVEEERERSLDDTGPCMEHMLRFSILKTAVNLGQGNFPPGMMCQVLLFHQKLLSNLNQQLIPHVAFHGPMATLITSCTQRLAAKRDGMEEKYFINFLSALTLKLVDDPHYINFFVRPSPPSFDLLVASAAALQSSNPRTARKAREIFLAVLEMSEEHVPTILAHTGICDNIADGFSPLFAALALGADEVDGATAEALAEWRCERGGDWRTVQKPRQRQHDSPGMVVRWQRWAGGGTRRRRRRSRFYSWCLAWSACSGDVGSASARSAACPRKCSHTGSRLPPPRCRRCCDSCPGCCSATRWPRAPHRSLAAPWARRSGRGSCSPWWPSA